MDCDKFAEYIERTLSFNGRGGREALCEKENIAWELHQSAAPAGSVLLGDLLIRNGVSFCRRELDAVPFARKLLKEGFAALAAKETKEHWDWYWLGNCHGLGRGTEVNHGKAADCFRQAREEGNSYAHYEEIWAAYLAGGPGLEAIFRFRYYSGPLQEFAEPSARALALLEMGPVRQVGSTQHICRILELSKLLREFYFHDGAHRHINVRVGKEMSLDVDALKAKGEPSAALALFLIATKSRANPTGKEPDAWLRAAVHPENRELLPLLKREILEEDRLKVVAEVCEANGWSDSPIGRFATWALTKADTEGDDGDSEWFP
jgi:hypothetical protein